MLVTQEQIFKKLSDIEKKLEKFMKETDSFSIEEISLNKACKLLKLGSYSVIQLVKSGKLQARVYRDSKRKLRYRFRLVDIRAFQQNNKYDQVSLHADEVESAEEIAKRFFNQKRSA
ncbi:MAG: hypothetical protein KGZ85_07840 [Ignavibacterium sp.]|nr:hypothetical protein [Ignavibacterium sp.]